MAWETRQRGGLYYTRSRRVNGRVVREYIGCGPVAELIAEADQAQIAQREAGRAELQATVAHFQSLEAPLDALGQQCRDLARIALQDAGYHQHHRGEWRKRRVRE